MRFLIFIGRQSRYAPPRIGNFSHCPIHGKHLFLGRSLSLTEFNDACDQVFVSKRGIPDRAVISCMAMTDEDEAKLKDAFNAPPPAPAPAPEPEAPADPPAPARKQAAKKAAKRKGDEGDPEPDGGEDAPE